MRTFDAVMPCRPWMAVLLALALVVPAATARADDLKDAKAALQAGRLDEAAKLFEKAAGQGVPEGRAGVGLVLLKRHQYARATEAFDTALKMDGSLALAHYGKGEVLREQERCEQALPELQRAVELDRKFPEAQLALSDCLVKVKRFNEAVAAANRGLNWGKWRPKFLVALGNVAAARDSLRDASIWYTTAVQESPEDPETHRALGEFYVKRGTFELAYPELQRAVAGDTGNVELHFSLGQALYYGQRYNDALEEYRWVVSRDPDFPPGELALGDLLYRSGKADPRRYVEARAPLEKYVQLVPEDPRGWSVLGRTLYFLGEKDAALENLNKAETLGDKNKELYTIRARIYTEKKELEKAAADYAKGGGEMDPADMLRMAQMMVIQKNTAKAESLYWAVFDQDSTTRAAKFALSELGKLRFRQGASTKSKDDYAAAVSLFQRRIALDPNSDEAYYFIGLSYKELGQYPEALEALKKSASLADTIAERHFWVGILEQQLKDDAAARAEFQRAVDLDPQGKSPYTALALRQAGFLKLVSKDYAAAVSDLERSADLNGKDVQTLVWLAQAYQNSGNRAKASQYYRRALELDPKQAEAQKGLKSLEGGAK